MEGLSYVTMEDFVTDYFLNFLANGNIEQLEHINCWALLFSSTEPIELAAIFVSVFFFILWCYAELREAFRKEDSEEENPLPSRPPRRRKGHYRYTQAFYELGNIEKAKEVNCNGQVVCKDANNGSNSISYLKIQVEKLIEKESEEDEVPDLVDASSSSSESAESEEEPGPPPPRAAQIVFPPDRREIDIGVQQKILEHKHTEDEKERKKEEKFRKIEEKKKEREKRKKKQEAEQEERRKEVDAKQKRLKEEKEKQKEVERAKKAEKKRKEEERALAEKERMEKLAAKHALEETLKQGSDAFLDKRGRQAVMFYQKAQDLINQSTEQWGGLREEDYVTYLYAWGMAGLESGISKEVHDAVQRFETMLSDHSHVRSPLAYYGLAYAYFKHYKFHDAFEPLDKCEKMATKLKYVVETWPGTTQSIQETTKGQLKVAIDNLRDRCKNPPPADATCRHPDCTARREIYRTDLSSKVMYVSFVCSEHCMIDYHVACWKRAKSEWKEEILHDKDVINKHCNTPDCLGEVISLTIYGSDGLPKVEARGEQAKKDKGEKVKTKGNKSKQERKKQKKHEAKKNSKKGQGDNGERLNSVTSSHSSHSNVAEELKNPSRAKKHDDDTMSSVSSRQGGSGTQEGNMSDIDDILDADDLPITIPDATYVLKRDDMEENNAPAKKSKQSKAKCKKKKAKPATDLNIQLQFVDDGQRSLMTSEDVVSPEAKKYTPYTQTYQDNPFAVPQHLREQASNFEHSLPPSFSRTVKEGQSFADVAKTTNMTETDEEKSQKIALLFHLSDLFDKLGPVVFNDPRLEMELDKLPDAQLVISRYGGLRKFLLQSSDFFVLEDYVSLARDQMKCHEMFTERNNRLQEAGLPLPPITGIGFNAPARNNVVPLGPAIPPHMPPVHYTATTSDPVGSNGTNPPNGIGGVDALDNFDIPPSGGGKMDGIDVINMELPSNGKTSAAAAADIAGRNIDKELDHVLEAQQLNGGNSLQSLSHREPFSTKTGTSPHRLGVKSVSMDISSLPSFDSGLGSMPPTSKTDHKNTLQSNTGTSVKTDITCDDKNNDASNLGNVAGNSVKELPMTNGGQIGGTATAKYMNAIQPATVSPVEGNQTLPKCDAILSPVSGDSGSGDGVVVRDFADGMDTSAEQKLSPSAEVDKVDSAPSVDTVERKSQVVKVDIRDKAPSMKVSTMKVDAKLEIVGNVSPMSDEATVLAVDYQKLLARYKIVHNACKNFQEKRKNMKTLFTQTVVVKYCATGMNTDPFMEFEELKVIKERLQGSLRDTMQKYMHLQMTSSNQMDAMKLTLEKKDAKEKELTNAVADAKRQHESDLKQWQIEKTCSAEDTKTRDSKIQTLESEKNILQTQLAAKESALEDLQRKTPVERDLWIAEKLKLQEALQASERNQKLLLQRSVEAEILVLQEHCKGACRTLENWLREGEFHLNNFKINLQRTPDNLKMKEGFTQWQNAVTENKQKLELLKSKYEEQIGAIHAGHMLSQLPAVEVPKITKPTLPPPGAFMGPRPGMMPPHLPPGVRPPVPVIPQSTPSPDSSSSPSPTLSQSNVTNPTPSQPMSVSVPVSLGDVNAAATDSKLPFGPAEVTPAQVTVPLQEQAPWPPAASSTPANSSPPGMPAASTAPSVGAAAGGNGLGAVGSSRPQSVSGANATPGNNRPVKQPQPAQNPTGSAPAAAAGTAVPLAQQPRTNFERILFPLQAIFPQHNQVQFTKAIKEVRQANKGSLSGLSVDEIIRRASTVLKRQPPLRPPSSSGAGAGAAAGANKGWQPGQVPQGQCQLAQGIMQGMAAQQGKFQWSSELGGSSAFGSTKNWDDDEDPCVICHEEMTPETTKILSCGHRFHAECIKQWLNKQSTCPNCRNYTLLLDEYPSL